MPRRSSGVAGWSPLHSVDRKLRGPPSSFDVFYGNSPTGTFDQPTRNSSAPLRGKHCPSVQRKLAQENESNTHEKTGGQLRIRLCGLEYKGQRSTKRRASVSLGVGVVEVSRYFHGLCRLGLGCGE